MQNLNNIHTAFLDDFAYSDDANTLCRLRHCGEESVRLGAEWVLASSAGFGCSMPQLRIVTN